ncbi:hypothetical protein NDU88_010811 [Pleurodeles waltl]|uniref:Uncharacterized protein n=1 Tax=Pleurodeles waltl TaxID=8319 RepID=A0AAV7S276_PLEWA|nr:hypothetical protein NDU88_010811 [Pleurodeles waltl]
MDRMSKRLDKQTERLDQAERRMSAVEDGQTALAAGQLKVNTELGTLRHKMDNLESRSRRNNLRIVGIAESTSIASMENFIESLLIQLLGRDTFSALFEVEQAHRDLSARPPPGAPPRLVIARLLNYRDRDAALRRARELKTLRYEGMTLSLYPDFTLQLLEGELSQLEQEHRDTADKCTLGYIRAKVQEFQETALSEVRHMGKYAVARAYGEGDRLGRVIANLIRPSRSTNLFSKTVAADGSIIGNPESVAARFREYYQTLNTTRGAPEPNAIKEYPTHIVLPKLSDSDREALGAPFTLGEITKALGGMAEGKAPGPMA